VLPYWERVLARFPDVRALAAAPLAEVLHAWAGLGYYSRARNLHAAARRVVAEHAGRFPADEAALRALPGIGRYTAGAILSIAFDQPAAILDGNVVRVLSRLLGLDGDVETAALRRRLWERAATWADGPAPGDANQALMELGATVCVKPLPRCTVCPLESLCAARLAGRERELPRPRARPVTQRAQLAVMRIERRGCLLLVRRSSGRLLRDWWELPSCRCPDGARSEAVPPLPGSEPGPSIETLAGAALRRRLQLAVRDLRCIGAVRHGILHHDIEAHVLTARAAAGPAPRRRGAAARAADSRRATPLANLDLEDLECRWVGRAGLGALPLSTLARKALRAAEAAASA
jgi:A/G-specific adenine glycosylase